MEMGQTQTDTMHSSCSQSAPNLYYVGFRPISCFVPSWGTPERHGPPLFSLDRETEAWRSPTQGLSARGWLWDARPAWGSPS